jgi:hypothetical protein
MRKSTTHGRMLAAGLAVQRDSGAILRLLVKTQQYGDALPDWAGGLSAKTVADEAERRTWSALDLLLLHQVPPEDTLTHDILAHAIGVAHIRALQIQPDESNPMHLPLCAAKDAMYSLRARWEEKKTWGLTGPERQALIAGVEIYEQLLQASSPAQMEHAHKIRMASLKKGNIHKPKVKK